MTWIRSEISRATPRSWVIIRMPMPRAFLQLQQQVEDAGLHGDVQGADVGSSATSSCGSLASAMAISTRWSMPPESWCGYFFSCVSGVADVHLFEQPDGPGLGACVLGQAAPAIRMASNSWLPIGVHRAERGHRVLRDQGERSGRGPCRWPCGSAMTSTPSIATDAGDHGEVLGQQAQDAHRRRRFAGTGLTDDGDGLARGGC